MCEHMNFWLHHIRSLEPRADCDQMRTAVISMSKYNGKSPLVILQNLYDDLICGIPFRQTSTGKIISYMFS